MESRLSTLEGKYEILGMIHEGPLGTVYKVRHRRWDQVRVVKVMRPQMEDDPSHHEQFIHEAQAAVRLDHPNVARFYEFQIDSDGTAYIVMEFVAGHNLHEIQTLLEPMDVGVIAQLASQALAAIGHLHKGHLMHRGISPDNLLITADSDGEPQVKLIDFGTAKSLDSRITLAETGVFIRNIDYASPEHFGGPSGVSNVEPRSDLYSLAAVIYEALTSMSPVAGNDTAAIIASHLFSPPRAFSESDPHGRVPDSARQVILTGLAKDPDDRYRDAEAFDRALQRAAEREIAASREPGGSWARLRAALEKVEDLSVPAGPSSTQERLEVLFPTSGKAALKARAEDADPRENEELAAQLLIEARRFLDGGQPDQALIKVRQVLAMGSKRTEALQIRVEIEKAHADLVEKLRALRERGGAQGGQPDLKRVVESAPPAEEPPPQLSPGDVTETHQPKMSQLLEQFDEALMEDFLGDAESHLLQLEEAFGRDHEEVASRARRLAAVVDKRQAGTLARDSLDRLGHLVDAGHYQQAEQGLAEAKSQYGRAEDGPTADWGAIEARIRAGREMLVEEAKRLLERGDLAAVELAIQKARQEGAPLDTVLRLERDLELMTSTEPPPREQRVTPPWLWAAGALALIIAAGVGIKLFWQTSEAERPIVTSSPESQIGANSTGMLRLDALPWIELVSIVDAADRTIPTPADTYTPVALELPSGTYILTLSHPRLAEPRELQVTVQGGETVLETLEVKPYSSDQYFEARW